MLLHKLLLLLEEHLLLEAETLNVSGVGRG